MQGLICLLFAILNFSICVRGWYLCKYKQGAFTRTPWLYPLSIFVWADAVVFGAFLGLSALICFLFSDFILFLLILSLFWLVRSIGETIYWFCEQFATNHKNPVDTLPFQNVFHGEAIWFVFQIFMQCVTVVTAITTVYLFSLWL